MGRALWGPVSLKKWDRTGRCFSEQRELERDPPGKAGAMETQGKRLALRHVGRGAAME